jgi:hypothetical protein
MFLRTVQAAQGHTYLRLVENFRQGGQVKQRVILHVGRAHVFVAALAFLLDRALEKKWRYAGSSLSSPLGWRALETVRCVEVDLETRRKLCVSRGSQHAAPVLKALGITQLDPPQPPKGEETLM